MKTMVEGHHLQIGSRRARTLAVLLAAALLSAPVLAQRHAQPRSGGSSSGGGSSSRGGSPPGGSSGGAHRPSGPSASGPSSGHRDGGSSPHRPTGSYYGGSGHGHGHYPYYNRYYPYFSFGFGYYSPYYYGYYPYYGYAPYYYGYYGRPYYRPYGYSAYDGAPPYYERQDLGAVALKVRPKTAEVYLDGRYVGAAGSFDGFPGYLWLEPGSYGLALVQEGYANLEREIEVSPGQVIEFKLRLDPGVAARPEPGDEGDYGRNYQPEGRRDYPDGGRRDYPPPGDYEGREREEGGRGGEQPRDAAELVLEVRPGDASVYLDGRFVGTGDLVSTSTEPLVVRAGEHRLQVIHPDFETEEVTVTVRPGEERLVEITLGGGV